ncbi:THAP domain-containing protein 5-like [Pectinophora gossypiella]|nr:THAP domain-containing protein 5-like [Pectinophora gossypiella]
MPYCCVITCKNHSGKTNVANSGISYHRFPADPDIKEKWIQVTGRADTDWLPQKTSTICSRHFDEDVIYTLGKSRRVPDDAVPTLNLPTTGSESGEDKMQQEEELASDDEPIEKYKVSKKKLQASLDRANKLIKKQTLLIKRLREQNRRDSKKITLQNRVLNDLMEIYQLRNEDIAVLRTEILKSEEPDSL